MVARRYDTAHEDSPDLSRPLLLIAAIVSALLFLIGSRAPVGAEQQARNDTRLIFSTYLPGPTDGADPVLVAVDHRGQPYITSSGFIGKLDVSGRRFLWQVHLPVSVRGIALDRTGALYLTGLTYSRSLAVRHAFQKRLAGQADAFVAKLSPAGRLVYASYLGGTGYDWGTGIAVDRRGDAYVAGTTDSGDFPMIRALQRHSANRDAFVAKVDPSGSGLIYSTYLGGVNFDGARGIGVDRSGAAVVVGGTNSPDFPVSHAFQASYVGATEQAGTPTNGSDAFVTKIAPGGTRLVYSTYLGGSEIDVATGVASDRAGNAYVVGSTSSRDFPVRNAFQSSLEGTVDAFVTKLSPKGQLVYSTYLGDSDQSYAWNIAVTPDGTSYVAGSTQSGDMPSSNPLQGYAGGTCDNGDDTWPCPDAFLATLSPSGQPSGITTELGGSGADWAYGIAVDGRGNAYLSGMTASANFPVTRALQPHKQGRVAGFLAKIAIR
jgi:hypothetical protein